MTDKYIWSGEQLPKLEEHSKKKHDLIYEYIVRYITTLMLNPKIPQLNLSIVDGFAGGGKYTYRGDTQYGSPIVILQALKKGYNCINKGMLRNRNINYQLFLVEKNRDYYNYLQETVTEYQGKDNLKGIYFYQGDFNQRLPKIISEIKKYNKSERALFILDQYAYKDVPIQNINHIFSSLKNPEVILTFNIGSLMTYFSDKREFRTILHNLGLNDFPWSLYEEYKEVDKKSFIQYYITKAILDASGAKYITPFFFSRQTSNNKGRHNYYYWLIHLSSAFRANDVMKSIHWSMRNDFSNALELGIIGYNTNYDNIASAQHLLDFGDAHSFDHDSEEKSINILTNQISEMIFNRDAVKFSSLMDNIANRSMADEKVIKKTLEQAMLQKDLIILDPKGKKRLKYTTIKSSDLIIPNKQLKLFL